MSCSWESLSVKTVVECCKNSTSEWWRGVVRARKDHFLVISFEYDYTLVVFSFTYKEKWKEKIEEMEAKTAIFGEKKNFPFNAYTRDRSTHSTYGYSQ